MPPLGPGVAARRSGERAERFGDRPERLERPERFAPRCWVLTAEMCEQPGDGAVTAETAMAAGLSCSRSAMAAMSSTLSRPAARTASDIVSGSLFRKRH